MMKLALFPSANICEIGSREALMTLEVEGDSGSKNNTSFIFKCLMSLTFDMRLTTRLIQKLV